jgi:hypothetical protein
MNQELKVYTLKQVEQFCKDYKFCCLEDVNGNQKYNWNGYTAKIQPHFKNCVKRFHSEALPAGYYNFCFTNSVRTTGTPDKFLVCKGDRNKIHLPALQDREEKTFTPQSLLTMDKALEYITEISTLKVENQLLIAENDRLRERNEVLEGWYEAEGGENLSESKGSDVLTYLKDQAPTFLSAVDRFFENKEKDRELEYFKINKGIATGGKKKREIKKIELGSDAHLNLIRHYYKNSDEDKLNDALDKLEDHDLDKYNAICKELNITDEEETND